MQFVLAGIAVRARSSPPCCQAGSLWKQSSALHGLHVHIRITRKNQLKELILLVKLPR